MTKIQKIKTIILFSVLYLMFSATAEAAQLNLISQVQEVGVGNQFKIDLMLDAEGQDINAVEGKIIFPKNLLELKEIIDGDSIINLWVEKPKLYILNSESYVSFSGIIPGGFSGVLSPYYKGYKPGNVFSLMFLTKRKDSGAVEIKNAQVLLNDGNGTPAKTTISNFQFLISKQAPIFQSPVAQTKDTNPPELFTPEVSRDQNVFDGKWFLVFAAQDKGSGIDRYEAQEIWSRDPNKNNWQIVESPFVLEDQSRTSYIFVKAIDRAGNQRIVVVAPGFAPWYKKPIVDIIVGLIALTVLLLIVRWLWELRRK